MSHPAGAGLVRSTRSRPGFSLPPASDITELGFDRWLESYFLGSHRSVVAARKAVQLSAQEEWPVLIHGETGTGKDMIAQAIHAGSPRRSKEPHVVTVGGLGETSWSVLFGHRKGAFTGADQSHEGVFKQADGSTLILEDIADLPMKVQPMLLRAIEYGVFRPLGQDGESQVDVRVIATSNVSIAQEVHARRFRADLYQRISPLRISLPPLREHVEDLDVLVPHFLFRARGVHRPPKTVSPSGMRVLRQYAWPRNVRELEHLLYRASVELHGPVLEAEQLRRILQEDEPGSLAPSSAGRRSSGIGREELLDALRESEGNKRKAARLLRVAPATFYALLRRHKVLQHAVK